MAVKMKHAKGEKLNMCFNRKIKLEFHGARLTSDGGVLAYRELDEALELFDSVPLAISDNRTGSNIQHDMTNLLRQSVYSRLAGYEDVNDAQRLSVDPVMRAVTGKRKKNAASVNTMGRFEIEVLTCRENLDGLSEINGRWVEKAMRKTPHRRIILDMDSSESPVHGEQEGSAYNGHFGCKCYHPLFCFNQYGDCEGAMLRSGNVHSADRWKELLEPIIQRYEGRKVRKYFRGDAAFAKPEMYEYLEEKGLLYAIRLPANDVLRVGFIVTNMSARAAGVVYFYNRRGTAEQWIKGGKYALNWTRLSCKHFLSNQVRLCLFVLAYNLGNFLRRLALPGKIKHWSLRSLLVKLIKIGAKVLRHSRYVTFQMAEVAISKEIFAEILFRVNRLRNCSL